MFSTVIQQRGAYIRGGGGGGGLITGCIFLFPVRWAYNGGAYNRNFTVAILLSNISYRN